MPENASSIHRDLINEEAVDLARYESGELNANEEEMDSLWLALLLLLEFHKDSIRDRKNLRGVQADIEREIEKTYNLINGRIKTNFARLAKLIHDTAIKQINKAAGATIVTSSLTELQIEALSKANLVLGLLKKEAAPVAAWINAQKEDFKQRARRIIALVYTLGQDEKEIAKKLRGDPELGFKDGVLNSKKKHMEGITVTATHSIVNEVQAAVYAQNADIIKGLQWHTKLDGRACPTCLARHGLVWMMNADGSIGRPVGHAKAYLPPPVHVRCRCGTSIILRSWDELNGATEGTETQPPKVDSKPAPSDKDQETPGRIPARYPRRLKQGDSADAPASIPARPKPQRIIQGEGVNVGGMTDGAFEKRIRRQMAKDGAKPADIDKAVNTARSRMDGKVSDSDNLDQWLRKRPESDRRALLGPSRAKLFNEGRIGVRDLTDQKNRPLTLDDLEEKIANKRLKARETEGRRTDFLVIAAATVAEFSNPQNAAKVERDAIARIEDTVRNPQGREGLANELQNVLREKEAEGRSPAENLAWAEARNRFMKMEAEKARVLRNARDRIIKGQKVTPSQRRVIDALTDQELWNFEEWVKLGEKSIGP